MTAAGAEGGGGVPKQGIGGMNEGGGMNDGGGDNGNGGSGSDNASGSASGSSGDGNGDDSDSSGEPGHRRSRDADRDPEHQEAARRVLAELGLTEATARTRPVSGHHSSIPIPCEGVDGRAFLLKFFIPPADGKFYPPDVRLDDYSRREAGFYRFLDTIDPARKLLPAPRTVLIDSRDPPRWILLERIRGAVGPAAEVLAMDHVFTLLKRMQNIPLEMLLGRRHFPLSHWETVSYLERARLMYDPVLFVIGEKRWNQVQKFFQEAMRWTETRRSTLVHGDFTEQNILVSEDGHPFLLDFERVGVGNEDHDFAWFWIHNTRAHAWKKRLLERYFEERVGSDRIRSQWGIRAALVYLALRRLRFNYLTFGQDDPLAGSNLALLDAALYGGDDLFPV